MRVAIVAPVDTSSSRGNGVTARRWQALLAELGHTVVLGAPADAAPSTDLLIALHARKSAAAIQDFQHRQPGVPIVLAMTGTDLHIDLPASAAAQASVARADRIVVLYHGAQQHLDPAHRDKVHVILQSVPERQQEPQPEPAGDRFEVCVLAHLRDVKDPLCAARAAARVPTELAVQVSLAGGAIEQKWLDLVAAEQVRNQAFTYLGELDPQAAAGLLGRSHAMVISSRSEGGANVLSEAIVAGVPVLASRIDGNVGLLGADYTGYFPVGDDAALAVLLGRAARDRGFLFSLRDQVLELQPRFEPARERESWAELLAGLHDHWDSNL